MQATDILKGPVPGQSLTQDPESRGPWEQAPKFNTANQALDHLLSVMMSKGFMDAYDTLLREDKQFYVDELVVGMLSEGFINGLWTPDTMMLLVEPLTAMMVWVAAQLNRSPSFSNDTGYEDRTGFEELVGLVAEEEEGPEEIPMETPEEPAGPTSPLTSNIPQSPLTGGL